MRSVEGLERPRSRQTSSWRGRPLHAGHVPQPAWTEGRRGGGRWSRCSCRRGGLPAARGRAPSPGGHCVGSGPPTVPPGPLFVQRLPHGQAGGPAHRTSRRASPDPNGICVAGRRGIHLFAPGCEERPLRCGSVLAFKWADGRQLSGRPPSTDCKSPGGLPGALTGVVSVAAVPASVLGGLAASPVGSACVRCHHPSGAPSSPFSLPALAIAPCSTSFPCVCLLSTCPTCCQGSLCGTWWPHCLVAGRAGRVCRAGGQLGRANEGAPFPPAHGRLLPCSAPPFCMVMPPNQAPCSARAPRGVARGRLRRHRATG